MREADDLFFDIVSQIRMPRWSSGRVALVGDAAYAPSFLSGQGSSLALVGAYVLAGELATGARPRGRLRGVRRAVRAFVEMNQALANKGARGILPRTAEDLARATRRCAARRLPSGDEVRRATTSLQLPGYPR